MQIYVDNMHVLLFLIITDEVKCIEDSVSKFYVALYVHIVQARRRAEECCSWIIFRYTVVYLKVKF